VAKITLIKMMKFFRNFDGKEAVKSPVSTGLNHILGVITGIAV